MGPNSSHKLLNRVPDDDEGDDDDSAACEKFLLADPHLTKLKTNHTIEYHTKGRLTLHR